MLVRRIHIIIGIILAPFIFITALTGALILITDRFWELLKWHSWFKWGGIVIGIGLLFLVSSGISAYIRTTLRKKRSKPSS
ncbi:MAG: hypothetical protein ABIK47_04220 [candidate division WOR-3 bacterium]